MKLGCRIKSGFNLVEVIVALGIISSVFVIVATLFVQLLRSSQKDADSASAALVAEKVVTERLQQIYGDVDASLTKEQFFSQNTPDLEGQVVLNHSTYHYRISHLLVVDNAGNPVGGTVGNQNRLKKLNIVVWWGDNENEVRFGSGGQQIEATRLVNENTDFDS